MIGGVHRGASQIAEHKNHKALNKTANPTKTKVKPRQLPVNRPLSQIGNACKD